MKKSTDSQVQKELSSLIEHLKRLEMPQFDEGLNTLKGRVCQGSAPIAFVTLRQRLEEFEQQNQSDLDRALKEPQPREKAFQELSKEIETRPTQLLLFSLLKTKKIAASSKTDFHYEQERCALLNETIEGSLAEEGNITRRQQKALNEINHLIGVKTPELFLQTTLDIKNDFVIPLFYPLAALAVYHGIESTNTLEIIDELEEQGRITEQSKILLKQAVAAIYLIRVRLHFQFRQHPWEGSHDEESRLSNLPNTLQKEEQKALDRAYWMVERPLHDYLSHCKEENRLTGTIDLEARAIALFEKEIPSIESQSLLVNRYRSFVDCYARYLSDSNATLKKHRDFYNCLSASSFYEPLREIYIETLIEAKVDPTIIDTLAVIPNRDGYRQSYRMAHRIPLRAY